MTAATDFAADVVARVRAKAADQGLDVHVSSEVIGFNPPGVLVIPVPTRRTYLYEGYDAEWTLALIAPGSGSLTDALAIDRMTDLVVSAVPEVATVELASYQLPGRQEPYPAALAKFENTITEE